MNEAETRAELIDPKLKASGWGVVEGAKILRERNVCKITDGKIQAGGGRISPLIADYILVYKGIKLAVVEAKSEKQEVGEGVAQAKLYAQKLNLQTTYSTNGKQIYQICLKTGKEGLVTDFLSPQALWNKVYSDQNDWRDKFFAVPYEDKGGLWQSRYYQDNAINQALNAIANNKTRILLTLATGTGKTAIAFQIAWKLFCTKWNLQKNGLRTPRILFLADRNILANQAFNAFSAFEEEALIRITPDEVSRRGKVPTHGSIYFSIFQSFMTEDEQGFRFGQYPTDFFDFIIVDECHRGGANDEGRWRGILEHFICAVQLGLTATPKREINADTYAYFGQPVFVYSLKEGINDGFLTPFRVQQIASNLDDYVYDDNDIVIDGEVKPGDEFSEKDFNRRIIIKKREVHRVKKLLTLMKPNEKSIIFCKTQKHALMIRDLVNQLSASKNIDYCHRVTADDGDIGNQNLEDFKDNEKSIPTVLTTSQKLSTGVDMIELKNIVLLRPINSMIEFKQIIGRGTRLFEGKDYFTIIDFVKAHHHFKDPEWDGEPLAPEPLMSTTVCVICHHTPCICQKIVPQPCEICGFTPCECIKKPPETIKIKLADSYRIISSVNTTFWDISGKPISAQKFLKNMFGELPNFFTQEEELRRIWANPSTRKKLLEGLSNIGYEIEQLQELQSIINANDSDLFDVLSYIAFDTEPLSRSNRVKNMRLYLDSLNERQTIFIEFVLDQYLKEGVEELDEQKLPDLLDLKYHSSADAQKTLGDIEQIKEVFVDFQQYLYA